MEYRLFFLTSGQQAPEGSTSIALNDGIVWIGETDTFPSIVLKGNILPTDMEVSDVYDNRLMTEDEIISYQNIINNVN